MLSVVLICIMMSCRCSCVKFWGDNAEFSCDAESPARSEPGNRPWHEPETRFSVSAPARCSAFCYRFAVRLSLRAILLLHFATCSLGHMSRSLDMNTVQSFRSTISRIRPR